MREAFERRRFFALLGMGVAGPMMLESTASDRVAASARALSPGDGELCYVGPSHDPVRLKVESSGDADARLSMIVQDVSPGGVIPVHLHEREDEIILIQAGEGVASLDGREVALVAGSVLWVPQGTWHGGRNSGTTALVWTGIYSPPGFEGYFREISVPPGVEPRRWTPEEISALNRRYHIRYR